MDYSHTWNGLIKVTESSGKRWEFGDFNDKPEIKINGMKRYNKLKEKLKENREKLLKDRNKI